MDTNPIGYYGYQPHWLLWILTPLITMYTNPMGMMTNRMAFSCTCHPKENDAHAHNTTPLMNKVGVPDSALLSVSNTFVR